MRKTRHKGREKKSPRREAPWPSTARAAGDAGGNPLVVERRSGRLSSSCSTEGRPASGPSPPGHRTGRPRRGGPHRSPRRGRSCGCVRVGAGVSVRGRGFVCARDIPKRVQDHAEEQSAGEDDGGHAVKRERLWRWDGCVGCVCKAVESPGISAAYVVRELGPLLPDQVQPVGDELLLVVREALRHGGGGVGVVGRQLLELLVRLSVAVGGLRVCGVWCGGMGGGGDCMNKVDSTRDMAVIRGGGRG